MTRRTVGQGQQEREDDRLTCVGLLAACGALITLVLLMSSLATARWSLSSAGSASLGLFDICTDVEYYDPRTNATGIRNACAGTHATSCTYTLCTTVAPDNRLSCSTYQLFNPDGFQTISVQRDELTPSGGNNVRLADPTLVFPGEGSCAAYHTTKALVLFATVICFLGFFCAPFTCCYFARGRKTLLCSIAMYVIVAASAIAAVAVYAGSVYNPSTSVQGEAFWLAVSAACIAGLTVPLVVLSPSRAAGDVPPYGAGGYPYQQPAKAGLYMKQPARPQPPVGGASSNYPQPGNRFNAATKV